MDIVGMDNLNRYDTTKAVIPKGIGLCNFCKEDAGLRAYFNYTEDQEIIDQYSFYICQRCYGSHIASKPLERLKHIIPLFKVKKAEGLSMAELDWVEYHSDELQGHLDSTNTSAYVIFMAGDD